ncbi:MAG: GGDEF domain-containing phosphodiesterase, partial [Candidatus Thiodiazotropha endolucinida]
GIAHYPDDGEDLSSMLKAADTSLYSAKEHGKNQYAFYRPELTHRAEHRFRVEQALREAVEKQQLSLVYQPQILMRTGEIIGVEALSRWNHPQLGQIPPTEFIATAERIGMIKPLTEWVLRTACNHAVACRKAGLPAVRMAVNISPSHFLEKDFVFLINRVIEETGMNPTELELEVTENVVQTNPENLTVFRELKDLGVLIAIDDFGVGYSSFASLKHLTADYLKIDRHFVNDMLSDDETQLLITSMIDLGHKLQHRIIAEGVETDTQFEVLNNLGCDTAQGYLFSKPVDADEIMQILKSNIENGRSMWS